MHASTTRTVDSEGRTVASRISEWAERDPLATCVTVLGDGQAESLTFGDLQARVEPLRAALCSTFEPGSRILLAAGPTTDFVVALQACLTSGFVPVPVPPPHDPQAVGRLPNIVEDAQPSCLMTSGGMEAQVAELVQRVPSLAPVPVWTPDAGIQLAQPSTDADEVQVPGIDDLAILQYTSGSTSKPRGTMVTHRNVEQNLARIKSAMCLPDRLTFVNWLPLHHDMGLFGGVLLPLAYGGHSVLMSPSAFVHDPARWLEAISTYRADISSAPSFAYDLCAKRVSPERKKHIDLSGWSSACVGADMVRADSLHAFAMSFAECGFDPVQFRPCYGLAEATLMVTTQSPGTSFAERRLDRSSLERGQAAAAEPTDGSIRLVGCGDAQEGEEVLVVDPSTRRELPDSSVGELWFRGPSVANGYWNQPEASEERFGGVLVDDPACHRYLRTGDLAFRGDDGIYLVGRSADLIVLQGENHYATDLEQAVEGLDPALRAGAAAAFAVEDPAQQEQPHVVLAHEVRVKQVQGRELDLALKLRKRVHEACGVTVDVVFLKPGSLPKTSSGKVQRRLCRSLLESGRLNVLWAAAPAPAGESEQSGDLGLAAARRRAREVLVGALRHAVGPELPASMGHTPMNQLGLDSMRLMSLRHSLQDSLRVDLRLDEVYSDLTVDEIIELLAHQLHHAAETLATPIRVDLVPTQPERESTGGAADSDLIPLLSLQQAYCAGRGDSFELGNVAGHVYAEFDATGLDLARLEDAWRRLVGRHEALRVVVNDDGQQILDQMPAWSMPVTELLNAIDTETTLTTVREEMSHAVMPLGHWPMFDLRCSRTSADTVRVHLSLDLLVVDATAILVLFDEWRRLYERDDVALPPTLGIRAGTRQVRALSLSSRYAVDADYWDSRVRDMPAAPILPTRTWSAKATHPRFVRHHGSLTASQWGHFKANATRAGVTPTTALLAAYGDVLAHWSEEPIFTVSMTRTLHGAGGGAAVGPFSSFTPTTIDTRLGTFGERAAQLQQRVLQDLEHDLVDGVEVIRRLVKTHRGTPGEAMLPVVFTPVLGDLRVLDWLGEQSWGITQTPQVCLDHQAFLRDGALDFHWDSADDLFPGGMVADMLAAYQRHLSLLADCNDWSEFVVDDLQPPLHKSLVDGVNTTASTPKDLRLEELFAEQVTLHPGSPSVIAGRRVLTYRELATRAAAASELLRTLGVEPGDVVGLCLEYGWEQAVAVLGVLGCGGIFAPVSPELPAQRRTELLARLAPKAVLTQSRIAPSLDGLDDSRIIAVDAIAVAPEHQAPRGRSGSTDDVACLIFTSGSTGTPRPVQLTHRAIVNAVTATTERYELDEKCRVLAVTDLQHDMALFDLWGPLSVGGAVVCLPHRARRDPSTWLDQMEQHHVTGWNSVPTTLQMLLEQAEQSGRGLPPDLRLILVGGDWIPLEMPARTRALATDVQFVSVGGPTESTLWSIWHDVRDADAELGSIPYGLPLPNLSYHVLDDRDRERPVWAVGEVCCAGVGVSPGYWRDPAATAEKFWTHPVSGLRMLRSGDLGRRRPDGTIQLMGRRDTQLKIDGIRIDLREVETELERLPGVGSCVVTSVPDATGRPELVAHVVCDHSAAPPASDWSLQLRADLLRRLPVAMIPTKFRAVPSLPITENHKLDRALLARQESDRPDEEELPSGEPASQPTDLAARIRDLICEATGLPRHTLDRDLAGEALTSLQMVRVANHLEEALGDRPGIEQMFRFHEVGDFVAWYSAPGGPSPGTANGDGSALSAGSPRPVEQALITDPAARRAFAARQIAVRDDLSAAARKLPDSAPVAVALTSRRTVRTFAADSVGLDKVAGLLGVLRAHCSKRDLPARRSYASGSGTYAVQTYVGVKPDRVADLEAGAYFYHPLEHQLLPVGPGRGHDEALHWHWNQPTFRSAAFSVFLVVDLRAIEPLYGERSEHFATVEAGLMTQLMELTAPGLGLGLCQIGAVNDALVREALELSNHQVVLHSLLAGSLVVEGHEE